MISNSHPEVFLEKGVLKIYNKFKGEHSCRSAISIKLLCNFIEITLQHGGSLVNFLHFLRTSFIKNTFGRVLLYGVNRNTKLKVYIVYLADIPEPI